MAKEANYIEDEASSSALARISDDDDNHVNKYSMNEILRHIALAQPAESGGTEEGLIRESEPEDDETDDAD